MIKRSIISTAVSATRVAIHTQVDTFNADLRQTRDIARRAGRYSRTCATSTHPMDDGQLVTVGGLSRRP